jgi:hypothetical protein
MRSSLTSASRFLSIISLAFVLALGACDDDDASCGPDNAPDTGIVATDGTATLTFGNLVSGLNNDCPAADAPAGVVSVSIAGVQTDGTGLFTICVGRPDLLASQALDLGVDTAGVEVRIVDVTGTADNCTYDFNSTTPPTGTASATGLCDNADNPAGFALVLDGGVTLSRTCGATVDDVTMTLRGRVAVTPDQ